MNERGKAVLQRLLGRREPSRELLLEVELLHGEGVDALCEMLSSGTLGEREQLRALHGLAYAAKHSGPPERLKVIDAALPRVKAPSLALRSRAAHLAVSTIYILQGLRRTEDPSLIALHDRVGTAVREAAKLGLVPATEKLVQDFLSGAARRE